MSWAPRSAAQLMPADPAAVAAYLAERAEQVSPAAVRLDRASIAAAHRACGEADPCVHEGVRQVMRGISRTGRDQGRGQVAGLDWRAAARRGRDRPGSSVPREVGGSPGRESTPAGRWRGAIVPAGLPGVSNTTPARKTP